MRRRLRLYLTVLALALAASGTQLPGRQSGTAAGIEQLAWISGSWEGAAGRAQIEEHWTPVAGGTILGVGRTIAGGKTVFFEYLRIESRGDGIYYVAQPLGRPGTSFQLTRLEGQEAVFENPQHDHPQRITYRRNPDGSLTARIEGDREGRRPPQEFHFRPRTKD